MGRPGTVPNSGLSGRSEVVRLHCRRCCRPYANRCHRVFLGFDVAPRCWIPTAADGSVDRRRRFFACRIHPQAGLRWVSLRSPFADKFLCLRPGASRRSPSARVSRLRLCFVVPAVTDIATWRKPQNMLVQTNRARGAAGFPVSVVFRQHHRRCPVM
jgi:hypothetical protein